MKNPVTTTDPAELQDLKKEMRKARKAYQKARGDIRRELERTGTVRDRIPREDAVERIYDIWRDAKTGIHIMEGKQITGGAWTSDAWAYGQASHSAVRATSGEINLDYAYDRSGLFGRMRNFTAMTVGFRLARTKR